LIVKKKKLQYKIPATSLRHRTTYILRISEAVVSCQKKLRKLALLTTHEGMCNKQQNQAGHSFHWQPNQNFSIDLIFHSQQI